MKTLSVVFSYNRPYLLDNCVRSFQKFGPGGDLLIFDDCSDDLEMKVMLEKFKRQGIWVYQSSKKENKQLGGLYFNMEQAVSIAKKRGYNYIFFIQDDLQFMWKDQLFWERVNKVFSIKKEAFHYRPQFEKIIYSHDKVHRFEYQPSFNCWLNKKEYFTAVGVISIKKIIELNWRFQPSEIENNIYAKSLGCRMYVSSTPVLAHVPTPETWHNKENKGKRLKPIKSFFLKPLSPEKIKQLKLKSHHNIIYLEDYCFPWGWKTLSPYLLSNGNKRKYYKNIWRWMKKNRFRRWPKLAGED